MKKFLVLMALMVLISTSVFAIGQAAGVYNKTMTSANTEYSQALPNGCAAFTVKCRGNYDIKLCFTAAGSGTTYVTVPAGSAYYEQVVSAYQVTLYFQCATASQVTEIVYWTE